MSDSEFLEKVNNVDKSSVKIMYFGESMFKLHTVLSSDIQEVSKSASSSAYAIPAQEEVRNAKNSMINYIYCYFSAI